MPTSLQQQSERIIDVQWAPSPSSVFLVAIQVEALDRHRLLSDVTRVLADEKVNILSASVTTSDDRVAISRFTFEMGDPKHLGHLLNVVRNVEGVYDVYRVTSAACVAQIRLVSISDILRRCALHCWLLDAACRVDCRLRFHDQARGRRESVVDLVESRPVSCPRT